MNAVHALPGYGSGNETVSVPRVQLLLDARKIEDGGIGMYIRNLLAGFRSDPSIEVAAIVKPGEESVALAAGARKAIPNSTPLYSRKELFSFAKSVDFKGYDLFHTPHFVLPFGIPLPTIVTIHDIIQITHPERFFYPFIAKSLLTSSLKRASKVITVSEATKRQLVSLRREASDKIEVIPNVVDPQFYLIDRLTDPLVGGDFVLSVFSNTKPHKSLKDLLSAFKTFKERTPGPLKLVLAGLGIEAMKHQVLHEDIIAVGAVTQPQMKHLMRYAKALIVPSIAEGFCLPVIEAQACGTSVIARPVPAILELITTNDHVCKDFSVDALVSGLEEFFKKRADVPDLLERGVPLSHIQRFDRAEVSQILARCYRSLLPKKSV